MNGPKLLLLYNTMVLPYLQYCLLNWGNFEGDSNKGLRGELWTLQKSLVRIVGESNNPISHTTPLFAKLGILKLDDLYTQRVRIFSFKKSRGLLPSGIAALFDRVSHTHNTRGARSNMFVTRSDPRSIKCIAPKYWNPLPEGPHGLKSSPSVASFKDHSKSGLLALYGGFVCPVRHGCLSRPP